MNTTAWDQLEDSKASGYEADRQLEDEFYCKICKTTYDDGDELIDIYHDVTTSDTHTYVGVCTKCYGG